MAQEARWKRACASIFSPPLPCPPDMQLMRSAHKTAQTAPPRARAHMPMPAHVRTGSEESQESDDIILCKVGFRFYGSWCLHPCHVCVTFAVTPGFGRRLAGVAMCGTKNRVQAHAAGLKRRTTFLPTHSCPGARLKLTRSGGDKYAGPRHIRGLWSALWGWACTYAPYLVRASRLWQPSWQGGGGGRKHGEAASAADASARCLMLLPRRISSPCACLLENTPVR